MTLEIFERDRNFLSCKIDGVYHHDMRRETMFTETPYYEPFLGWYVSEGWSTRKNGMLVIHHKVGEAGTDEPTKKVNWNRIDGFDYYTFTGSGIKGKEITYR